MLLGLWQCDVSLTFFRRNHNNTAKRLRESWGIRQIDPGSDRVRKGRIILTIAAMLVAIVVASPNLTAFRGGVADSNQQYGCSTGCHTVKSSSVITMWTSDATPEPGGTVTVTVNVTGGEASASPLGVQIISALTKSSSLPSDAGWMIVTDPTGITAYNYNEMSAYTGSLSMTWTLTAPSSQGVYTLFAREIHGKSDTYYNDFSGGIAFVVGGTTPDVLTVFITSPSAGSEVSGSISVTASILPVENITYATLSVDGVLVDNKTSTPYIWSLDTKQYTDGAHVLQVTAANSTGGLGTKEIAITVNNAATDETLLSWVWTIAAGSLLIIALLGVLVVVALLIRRRTMRGKVN